MVLYLKSSGSALMQRAIQITGSYDMDLCDSAQVTLIMTKDVFSDISLYSHCSNCSVTVFVKIPVTFGSFRNLELVWSRTQISFLGHSKSFGTLTQRSYHVMPGPNPQHSVSEFTASTREQTPCSRGHTQFPASCRNVMSHCCISPQI